MFFNTRKFYPTSLLISSRQSSSMRFALLYYYYCVIGLGVSLSNFLIFSLLFCFLFYLFLFLREFLDYLPTLLLIFKFYATIFLISNTFLLPSPRISWQQYLLMTEKTGTCFFPPSSLFYCLLPPFLANSFFPLLIWVFHVSGILKCLTVPGSVHFKEWNIRKDWKMLMCVRGGACGLMVISLHGG